MRVLDTDHFTLLERESPEAERLRTRLREAIGEEIAVTVVSFEEQTRGWMAYLARCRTVVAEVKAYGRLKQHLANYCAATVLDFDEPAAHEFQRLRRERIRLGTMDLKIAAIVLTRQGTLLSRNLRDFGQIPGLDVQDWTQ